MVVKNYVSKLGDFTLFRELVSTNLGGVNYSYNLTYNSLLH